jgi:hypothetical protein
VRPESVTAKYRDFAEKSQPLKAKRKG